MTVFDVVKNFLHNKSIYLDSKLRLIEWWIRKYYPNTYQHIESINYTYTIHEDEYEIIFERPIEIRKLADMTENEPWAEYTISQNGSDPYITITHTQLLNQNPEINVEDTVLGTFTDNQGSITFNPYIRSRSHQLSVSKSDNMMFDALELYFKPN